MQREKSREEGVKRYDKRRARRRKKREKKMYISPLPPPPFFPLAPENKASKLRLPLTCD